MPEPTVEQGHGTVLDGNDPIDALSITVATPSRSA
jgi:hypothetical protein